MTTPQFKTQLEIADTRDFITRIRSSGLNIVLIHEANFIDIVHEMNILGRKVIKFQSNVYDTVMVGNTLVTSNKNMPVRLFNASQEDFDQLPIASIYDRKPNSELFLTPLQLVTDGDAVLGGGKKHLTRYDLNKAKAHRFRSMDKKYISSVELKGQLAILGQFGGQLELFDLNSEVVVSSLKPHMDLVTEIKQVPSTQHYFLSLARKDNLCYLWDLRNLNQFVAYFQHPRHANQRTGLDVTSDGSLLYLGGEHGEIFVHPMKQNVGKSCTFQLPKNQCVSSILCCKQKILCSVGERSFPMFGQEGEGGLLMSMKL